MEQPDSYSAKGFWSIDDVNNLVNTSAGAPFKERWLALSKTDQRDVATRADDRMLRDDAVLNLIRDTAPPPLPDVTHRVARPEMHGTDTDLRSLSVLARLVFVIVLKEEHLHRHMSASELIRYGPSLASLITDQNQLNEVWTLDGARRDYAILQRTNPDRKRVYASLLRVGGGDQLVLSAAFMHFMLTLVGVERTDLFHYSISGRTVQFEPCPLTGSIGACSNPDIAAAAISALIGIDVEVQPMDWRVQQLATYLLHMYRYKRDGSFYKRDVPTALGPTDNFYHAFASRHDQYINENLDDWLRTVEIPTALASKRFIYVFFLYLAGIVIKKDTKHNWGDSATIKAYVANRGAELAEETFAPYNIYSDYPTMMLKISKREGPILTLKSVLDTCAKRRIEHSKSPALNETYKATDHDNCGPTHPYVPSIQYYIDTVKRLGHAYAAVGVIEEPDCAISTALEKFPIPRGDGQPAQVIKYNVGDHEAVGHTKLDISRGYPDVGIGQLLIDGSFHEVSANEQACKFKINNLLRDNVANAAVVLQLYPDNKLVYQGPTAYVLPLDIQQVVKQYETVSIYAHGKMHSPVFTLVCLRNCKLTGSQPRTDVLDLFGQFWCKLAMMQLGQCARTLAWRMGVIGGFGPNYVSERLVKERFWKQLCAKTGYREVARDIKLEVKDVLSILSAASEGDVLAGGLQFVAPDISTYEGSIIAGTQTMSISSANAGLSDNDAAVLAMFASSVEGTADGDTAMRDSGAASRTLKRLRSDEEDGDGNREKED